MSIHAKVMIKEYKYMSQQPDSELFLQNPVIYIIGKT